MDVVLKMAQRLNTGRILTTGAVVSVFQNSKCPPYPSSQSLNQIREDVQPAVQLPIEVPIEIGVDFQAAGAFNLMQSSPA